VTDKDTGKSKGFGFVEMPNPREAIKAIKGLNTLKVKGMEFELKQPKNKFSDEKTIFSSLDCNAEWYSYT
jgi:RNA recognition motif-containing protein